MEYGEFIEKAGERGKDISISEYEKEIEPLYMDSPASQAAFCWAWAKMQEGYGPLSMLVELHDSGASTVSYDDEHMQFAYDTAVIEWGLPWRKVKNSIAILTAMETARESTQKWIGYNNDDPTGYAQFHDLEGWLAGKDVIFDILSNLGDWGGTICLGSRSVTW